MPVYRYLPGEPGKIVVDERVDLLASTDAWTLMARSAGAGKVRHIRRPGPMRTVKIKLTIEGLMGEPICRPSSDVARCAD